MLVLPNRSCTVLIIMSSQHTQGRTVLNVLLHPEQLSALCMSLVESLSSPMVAVDPACIENKKGKMRHSKKDR